MYDFSSFFSKFPIKNKWKVPMSLMYACQSNTISTNENTIINREIK